MNIDDLLDLMDETLEDAFTVPLTGKRMVDAERLRDIIDDIRLNMPTEIRQAKAIVNIVWVIVVSTSNRLIRAIRPDRSDVATAIDVRPSNRKQIPKTAIAGARAGWPT